MSVLPFPLSSNLPRQTEPGSCAGWFERSDSPGSEPGQGRYVPVTRNGSLTGEKKDPCTASLCGENFLHVSVSQHDFFVDWITIQQVHELENGQHLPLFTDGYVECVNGDGEVAWKTLKSFSFEGSFDSRIQVMCDGLSVRMSGNVGRFGRRDNLFGFSLPEVIKKANIILDYLGLPHFTAGKSFLMQSSDIVGYTGAVISRLDLTQNYATGSEKDASDFLRWLSSQQDNRVKTGVYGDSHTVDFGRGSQRLYHKVYNKFAQLSNAKDTHIGNKVLEWVRVNGIIRHEITLKSRYLRDGGLRFLGVVDMNDLNVVYLEKSSIIKRADKVGDGFTDLPNHIRLTVRDYLAGEKFNGSTAKFYRHRKELLHYGIDIAIPSNVKAFTPKVRVIELKSVSAPEWYWAISVAA